MTTQLKTQRDDNGDRHLPVPSRMPTRSIISSIGGTIRASYDPRPITKPIVDADLTTLPAIPRIAEVCRYTLAKLEYSLSSGGGLRAWFKLNLLIALLIAIPALLVMPAVTLVLGTFATWTDFVAVAAINIFWATVAIIATAALITGALLVFRLFTARR